MLSEAVSGAWLERVEGSDGSKGVQVGLREKRGPTESALERSRWEREERKIYPCTYSVFPPK